MRIMGVLNASPESFYRASVSTAGRAMRDAAGAMEAEGADFVDVGGMSSAPYLRTAVPARTEERRVLAAVRAAQDATNLPVSVDTCRASVARAALAQGAEVLNDVTGLKRDPGMPGVVSEFSPSVVLCAHHPGPAGPGPAAARALLRRSVRIAEAAGASGIALDPAVGFFRREGGMLGTRIRSGWAERDLSVIRGLGSLGGHPVLVSVSRKSFLGAVLGRGPEGLLAGSLAAEAAAVIYGADVIRTHDVAASRDAAAVALRLRPRGRKGL